MKKILFLSLILLLSITGCKNEKLKNNQITKSVEEVTIVEHENPDEELIIDSETENIVNNDVKSEKEEKESKVVEKTPEVKKQSGSSTKNNKSVDNTKKGKNETVSVTKKEEKTIEAENEKNNEATKQESVSSNEKKDDSSSVNNSSTEKSKSEQSGEITFETPEVSSFENDSAYINLMKQIFATYEECDIKGREIRLSDMINISSTRCESVNYKGTEVGWRLKVRYTDGTWKEYKK